MKEEAAKEAAEEEVKDEILKEKEREERANEILEQARQWTVSEYDDDKKCGNAGYYGGFQLTDDEVTGRLRGAAKELIVMAGKKILNGEFNLTKISFPIKCMCPKTVL